jgi:hypothetical protein
VVVLFFGRRWICRYRASLAAAYKNGFMKTLTVKLPEALVAEIEAESRKRRCLRSDVVRERLIGADRLRANRQIPDSIAALIGSVPALPSDLSERKKTYLKSKHYGRKRKP